MNHQQPHFLCRIENRLQAFKTKYPHNSIDCGRFQRNQAFGNSGRHNGSTGVALTAHSRTMDALFCDHRPPGTGRVIRNSPEPDQAAILHHAVERCIVPDRRAVAAHVNRASAAHLPLYFAQLPTPNLVSWVNFGNQRCVVDQFGVNDLAHFNRAVLLDNA